MACCVVAAVILICWQRLRPWSRRSPDIAQFAPSAYRPAPGQPTGERSLPQREFVPGLPSWMAKSAWVLRYFSIGSCGYLLVVVVLLRLGVLHSTASREAWFMRTLFVGSLVVIAAALASQILGGGEDLLTRREIYGCALLGVGGAVFERIVVELDLISLYEAGSPPVVYAVHTVVVLVLIAGGAMVVSKNPIPLVYNTVLRRQS